MEVSAVKTKRENSSQVKHCIYSNDSANIEEQLKNGTFIQHKS